MTPPEPPRHTTGATVRLTNIHQRFGDVVAVRDVNLEVPAPLARGTRIPLGSSFA